MRRAARSANAWYPNGSNPVFPMSRPEHLAAGMARLSRYAQQPGRDPSEIEVVLRTHQLQLTGDGADPAFSTGEERLPFSGNAQQIASDVREYEGIGVGHLVVYLVRVSRNLDDMQRNMENFATKVWPLV